MQAPILPCTEKACEVLEVSDATLRQWRKEGLPHVMVGNRPRYFLDEVVAWLSHRQVAAVTAE